MKICTRFKEHLIVMKHTFCYPTTILHNWKVQIRLEGPMFVIKKELRLTSLTLGPALIANIMIICSGWKDYDYDGPSAEVSRNWKLHI